MPSDDTEAPGTMFFRPAYVQPGPGPDHAGSAITFEPGPDPLPVGVHEAVFLHDGREYPATLTVREDGSVAIHADLHPVD